MKLFRHLVFALGLATVFTTGCLTDDGAVTDDEPALETEAAERDFEQEPFCQTVTEQEQEWQACGIKPNGATAYKSCTRSCITHKHIEWNTVPATCHVGPKICSQWFCGECND